MLLAGLLLAQLTASLATPAAHAEPYALAEAGITLNLPVGWEMTRWSDWDFRGKHTAGMALEVWYSPWQLPVDPAIGPSLVTQYGQHLEEQRAGDVKVTPGAVETIGDVPALKTDMTFKFDRDGPAGVAHAAAFAAEGKLMHVVVYAPAANDGRARDAVDALVKRLTIEKKPADIASLAGAQKTALGLTAVLPAGWRAPLESEKEEAMRLASATPIQKPTACFVAAKPDMNGAPEVMFLCKETWRTGILDESSFEGEAPKLKALIFGAAAKAVPDAEPVETSDRMGVLFRPGTNDHDLRMGLLPYDQGQVVAWVVGPREGGAELETALKSTFTAMKFDGPDNGMPQYGAGEWVVHTLTYQPFHPAVLGCGGLALLALGGLGYLAFKPRNKAPVY